VQLVIDTYGASLGVKDSMFCVKTEDDSRRVSPDKVDSILITRSASVSTTAIQLAIEKGIEMVFMDRGGTPYARIWSNRFGSITTIRRKQLEFSRSKAAMGWLKKLVIRKMDNQQALALSLMRPDRSTNALIDKTVKRIEEYKKKVRNCPSTDLAGLCASLRGWEGAASRWYFRCISLHLPEQYRFEGRSQRPAADMFNAMLNYAYGILYHRVEGALISAGVDPYIGVLHRDEYNRPVFTYDFIENFRMWADYVVVNLCMQEVVFREFFTAEKGAYFLDTPGKRILVHAFNDYFSEVVRFHGKERSRNTHIDIAAQEFARYMLKWKHGDQESF